MRLRWFSVFSLLATLFNAPAIAQDNGRRVVLTAHVTVENRSAENIPFYFRVSVPAADHPQQRLIKISHPDDVPGQIKRHKNDLDSYLEYRWAVPARGSLQQEIGFELQLQPFNADMVSRRPVEPDGGKRFISPSRLSESNAPEIADVAAQLMQSGAGPRDYAYKAFEYASQNLSVRDMSKNRGALYALETGGGDCTEFNALFAALSRAMGVPARITTEFLFNDEDRRFSLPNHHGAEAYLDGRWLPVDANLAVDKSFGYGFGFGGVRKIVLVREGAWVWSSWVPDKKTESLELRVAWSLQHVAARSGMAE